VWASVLVIHEVTLALAVLVRNLEFQLLDPDYELIPHDRAFAKLQGVAC
jgi:hypothetical protein